MWQRALRYLGSVGWSAEDVERACEALAPLYEDLESGDPPPSAAAADACLGAAVSQRERDALLVLARVHDEASSTGDLLRAALRDFEHFVNDEG